MSTGHINLDILQAHIPTQKLTFMPLRPAPTLIFPKLMAPIHQASGSIRTFRIWHRSNHSIHHSIYRIKYKCVYKALYSWHHIVSKHLTVQTQKCRSTEDWLTKLWYIWWNTMQQFKKMKKLFNTDEEWSPKYIMG